MARVTKNWMISGLRSNFPCAAKFNGPFLFWKIFHGKRSKIAGSKLQLVPFDTSWYKKLIPQATFFHFTSKLGLISNWIRLFFILYHLKHLKCMSALMSNVKNPIFRFKISFFKFGCCTPKMHPWERPWWFRVQLNVIWDRAGEVLGCHQQKKLVPNFLHQMSPSSTVKSLWFKFGHDIFAGFKMARL